MLPNIARDLSSLTGLNIRLGIVYCVGWFVLTLIISTLFLLLPPSSDHVSFDYIGWIVSQGGTLYVDAADQNWPGQMLIHTLSNWLFGHELWSFRLFEAVVILPASCLVLYFFLNSVQQPLAAIMVMPLYQIMYMTSGMWGAGQRDLVAAPLLILAAGLMLQQFKKEKSSVKLLVLQGACIAAATSIRPTLLLIAPLLTFMDFIVKRHTGRSFITIVKSHTVVALTILFVAALCVLVGLQSGAFYSWYEVSVLFSLEVYSGSKNMGESADKFMALVLGSWLWYVVWSIIGAVILWKKTPLALAFSSVVIPVTLVSFFIQGKGLGYHLLPLIPLMAMLIACVIAFAVNIFTAKKYNKFMLFLACVLVLVPAAGSAKKMLTTFRLQSQYVFGKISKHELYRHYGAGEAVTIEDTLLISAYINKTTPKDANILFWGQSCHVYNLTNRHSPIFAASAAVFQSPTQNFSLFQKWYAAIESQINEHQPNVLLLVKDKKQGGYLALKPIDTLNPKFSDIVMKQLDQYTLEQSFGLVDLYRLNKASRTSNKSKY